jgi:hypothetical protein
MSESGIKLADLFRAVNNKNTDWWETLTEEQQHKFSSWLYSRYMSIVRHNNPDMHRYYLINANQTLNPSISMLTKNHAKLIYLLMTTMVNEYTRVDHQYIPPMKKNKANKDINIIMKLLHQIYPNYKDDELELLASTTNKKEVKQLLQDHGYSDKQIKASFK